MAAMAKKKSQNKKHKFKYAEPPTGVNSPASADKQGEAAGANQTNRVAVPSTRPYVKAGAVADTRDFSYVGHDLRRIAILAGLLLALEIALWYLFGHTGLGNTVYNLVKV